MAVTFKQVRSLGVVLAGLAVAGVGGPWEGIRPPRASATTDIPSAPGDRITAAEIGRRAAAAYARAGTAVVRVRKRGDKSWSDTGVIVTPDGSVLCRADSGRGPVEVRLSDGREATGASRGWSAEWGVGLIKLDGPGPWPHAPLEDGVGPLAGQCVVAFGYVDDQRMPAVGRPLLHVDWVTEAAPGIWFQTSEGRTSQWLAAAVVINHEGQVAGVGWQRWFSHGRVYASAKTIRGLWGDLAAGKNLDVVRLGGPKQPAAAPANGPIPQAVADAARAASVRIRRNAKDRGWSGTIVTADGLVATCAHHFVPPGTAVTVCVPDGRDVAGTVVGINPICDVGLVRITAEGPWPHVELGESTGLRPGDSCLQIGYGPAGDQDRQPRVRTSAIAAQWAAAWNHMLCTDPTKEFVGGDSGGGIFDAGGRLVAVAAVLGGSINLPEGQVRPHQHPRVELFRAHWAELAGRFDRATESPLAAADLRGAAAGPGVVEVLDGAKAVALGTVVGRGRILTLANALPDAPACRLMDGRVLPATVVKTVREHNLVVLKVEAADIPAVTWAGPDDPPVGAAVVVAGPKPAAGFVTHGALAVSREPGAFWMTVRDGAGGLEFVKAFEEAGRLPFRPGDVIRSIDGRPTPDNAAYAKFWDSPSTVVWTAGDSLPAVVTRDAKEVRLRFIVGPNTLPRPDGQSPRWSGFARAYGVAVDATLPLGGTVLDQDGRSIGVTIAWPARGWLLVLPASIAKVIGE